MKDELFNSLGMKNEFFKVSEWKNKLLIKFRAQNSILSKKKKKKFACDLALSHQTHYE